LGALRFVNATGVAGASVFRLVPGARTEVVEADQIDVVAAAVLRDVQQILDAAETGCARQIRRDVRDLNRRDRVHHDVSLVHAVTTADLDVGPLPDADAAPDSAASNPGAEAFGEDHAGSLPDVDVRRCVADAFRRGRRSPRLEGPKQPVYS